MNHHTRSGVPNTLELQEIIKQLQGALYIDVFRVLVDIIQKRIGHELSRIVYVTSGSEAQLQVWLCLLQETVVPV